MKYNSVRKTQKRYPLPVHTISRCRYTKKSRDGRSKNIYSCLPKNILAKIPGDVKKSCGNGADHCMLDGAQNIIDETERKYIRMLLRPRYPSEWINDPDAWLDNFQIVSVMKQFEADFPHFKFYGVFPIDFSAPNPYEHPKTQETQGSSTTKKCLSEELCTIHLAQEYEQGFRGLGVIFNLDPHFKSGSHWVGLYINIKNLSLPEIYYFDSYGMRAPRLIARLMKSFKFQNKKTRLMWNSRRFQYSDTECGMYSIYFLIAMLSGISFKRFCHFAVPDREMYELRKILFSL